MKKILFISLALILALGMALIGCEEGEGPTGDPIDLTVLIRTEDEREDIGNYLVTVLEDLGFDVTAQYGISSELGPIWQGEPSLGLWHAYTGGWVSTSVERDGGTNFGFMYTTIGMAWMPVPLWAAYVDEGEFYDLCEILWNNDFSTAGERADLFEDAMWLSMNNSIHILLLDRTSFSPLQTDVALAADAYGGIYASWLWALTAHFRDGNTAQDPTGNTTMRMSTTDLFIDPWNPVAGSNWAYDMFPIRATAQQSFVYDPTTGLPWPHAVEDAEIWWVDGLPIIYDADHEEGAPNGWLTHHVESSEIPVPGTAWADWDATTDSFIDADTRFGGPVTSKIKVVTRYADDIFSTPLHDGSTLSEADFLFYICQWFDRPDSTSTYYDPSAAPAFDAFMSQFKGVTYNFTPGAGYALEITTYTDQYYLDAELVCADNQVNWFPHDNSGQFVWHNCALGMLGERDGELAFSQTKADTEPTSPWTSFIDGPSLAILDDYLTDVQDSTPHADYRFVPYSNILGPYLTTGDIDTRYSNLASWRAAKGNFWVASGPYHLEAVDTLGSVIELAKFTSYLEDGDEWFFVMDPVPTYGGSNTGAWFDLITIEVDDNAAAVSKLLADQLDVYAFAIADADLKDTCDANPSIVHYYENAGSYNDITFNPDGPFFGGTGQPNPFGIPEVCQAMNWAMDREYICSDIMSGMAIPRYNCIGSLSGDGVLYSSVLDAIEAFYAYDFDAADAAIEAAMLAVPGITRDEDGTYRY